MQVIGSMFVAFSGLSMEQINGLVALFGLGVAGLALYVALVAMRGKHRR